MHAIFCNTSGDGSRNASERHIQSQVQPLHTPSLPCPCYTHKQPGAAHQKAILVGHIQSGSCKLAAYCRKGVFTAENDYHIGELRENQM